jgi:hypothetical protein
MGQSLEAPIRTTVETANLLAPGSIQPIDRARFSAALAVEPRNSSTRFLGDCSTMAGMAKIGNDATRLRLAAKACATKENIGRLSSGVEIECTLRQIEHPEGRFQRDDGVRYDVCVMEIICDPTLRPPSISRANFVGDRSETGSSVIRLGNVRQTSFRLRLISPGAAFGTLSATGKPGQALT